MMQTKEQYVGKMLQRITTEGHVVVFSEIFDKYLMPDNSPHRKIAYEAFCKAREDAQLDLIKGLDGFEAKRDKLKEFTEINKKDFEDFWRSANSYAVSKIEE